MTEHESLPGKNDQVTGKGAPEGEGKAQHAAEKVKEGVQEVGEKAKEAVHDVSKKARGLVDKIRHKDK